MYGRGTHRSIVMVVSSLGVTLLASWCQAGPLSDWLFGSRNDYYYPVGSEYVARRSADLGARHRLLCAAVPAANVVAGNSPVANYAGTGAVMSTQPSAGYYAPAPVTSNYALSATNLILPSIPAAATTNNGVTTYRLPGPVVTSPYAMAPINGTAPTAPVTSYYRAGQFERVARRTLVLFECANRLCHRALLGLLFCQLCCRRQHTHPPPRITQRPQQTQRVPQRAINRLPIEPFGIAYPSRTFDRSRPSIPARDARRR